MDPKARPPSPGPILFSNLFEKRDSDGTLETISEGISAIIDNAARLLSDVDLLVPQGRFSSARFLLTTAKEELGKAFILIDMCRLDFARHVSVLRRLAEAFYVHQAKQAYFNTLQFPGFASMDHVRRFWEVEIVRWWPSGDPESGEPDMPHDSYFDREFPLYVDFNDYNDNWTIPSNRYDSLHFKPTFGSGDATEVPSVRDAFEHAMHQQLLTPETLADLNQELSRDYFTEASPNEALHRAQMRFSSRVSARLSLNIETVMQSTLVTWPLYHFASHRF